MSKRVANLATRYAIMSTRLQLATSFSTAASSSLVVPREVRRSYSDKPENEENSSAQENAGNKLQAWEVNIDVNTDGQIENIKIRQAQSQSPADSIKSAETRQANLPQIIPTQSLAKSKTFYQTAETFHDSPLEIHESTALKNYSRVSGGSSEKRGSLINVKY